MSIQVDKHDKTVYFTLSGEMNDIESYNWNDAIKNSMDESVINAVVDLSGVTYISSSGLRILLSLQKEIDIRDGELVVKNLQPALQHIFDVVGFSRFIHIVQDETGGPPEAAGEPAQGGPGGK